MNASSVKVAVVGSINMDLVVRCASLPIPGQTLMADSSTEFCGGKGANQAVAAARAGAQVSMIGCVGNDAFASRLVGNLQIHEIDTQTVKRCDDVASGLAVITVDRKAQNSILVVPGANASLTRRDIEDAREVIESSDVVLLQLEIPVDAVLAAREIATRAGVPVVLDPAPVPQAWPDALMNVDFLCPNESEAEALTGVTIRTKEEAALAAQKLRAMGARSVAITMGEQGSLLLDRGEVIDLPAYQVNAVDTTAAGDAFCGAFAVRWIRTDSLSEAVQYAGIAGALAASRLGAQTSMATAEEIQKCWDHRYDPRSQRVRIPNDESDARS